MAGETKAEVDREMMLRNGAKILAPVLQPHGFMFVFCDSGHSSGGNYARGSFVRGDRKLEFSLRYSLGLVRYCIGAACLDHGDYIRQLGVEGRNSYPCFSEDVTEQFECLASDLSQYCGDFIYGAEENFLELVRQFERHPTKHSGIPK